MYSLALASRVSVLPVDQLLSHLQVLEYPNKPKSKRSSPHRRSAARFAKSLCTRTKGLGQIRRKPHDPHTKQSSGLIVSVLLLLSTARADCGRYFLLLIGYSPFLPSLALVFTTCMMGLKVLAAVAVADQASFASRFSNTTKLEI